MPDGIRSWRERGLQTLWFEGLGLAIVAPLYGWAASAGVGESFSLVAALSLVVMAWSALFNTVFDVVEFRLTGRVASARPRLLRVVHAIGFETTAMGVSVPVIYAMSDYDWMQALQADVALTLAYVFYGYVFHRLYDRWRPVSVRPMPGAPDQGLNRRVHSPTSDVVLLTLLAGTASAQRTHTSDADLAFEDAMVPCACNHGAAACTTFQALAVQGRADDAH